MLIGIANAEDTAGYYVDYYGVMQPLRIATTEEPAYSGDHSYTADTLGAPDNPSRGTFLKALIWPPLGKTISSPIAKVRVVTYIECISGDYNVQELEYRLYAYNIETGEITRKIHEDTWPPTGNTPTYQPLSYGLKTYDDTIICDTDKSALSEKETLILVSICHHFGARSHHTEYAAHFDTKEYPAYMEVFTTDGKSTRYYIHDSFTTSGTPTPTEEPLVTQLTTDPSNERNPDWSQDGTKIAYCRDHLGKYPLNIWVMNSDGSNKHALTHSTGHDANRQPKWSPDGTKITFWAYRPWGQGGSIWTMNADGSSQTKIYVRGGYDSYKPAFSPDGSKIAFDLNKRYGGGPHELYKMNPDGTDVVKILDALDAKNDGMGKDHGSISYSPDGRWIAFESERSGNWDIWIVKPDGADLTQLTTDSNDDFYPAWSPDGKQVAFTSDKSGNNDIWILTNVQEVIDGGAPNYAHVTTGNSDDIHPAWAPDGTKIAFSSDRSGNYDIWVASLTGVPTPTPTPPISPTPLPHPTNGPLKVKFEKTAPKNLKIYIENPGPDFVYVPSSTKEGVINFKISGITWGGKLEAYVESTHPHERWTIYAKDVYKDAKPVVTLVQIVLIPPKSAIDVAAMVGPILLESTTGIDPIGETLNTLIFHPALEEKTKSFILFTKCFLYCKHPKTENLEPKECDYFIWAIGKCSCYEVVECGKRGRERYIAEAHKDYKNKYDLPKKGAGYVLLPESRLVIELTYEKIREDKLGLMIKEYQALHTIGGTGTCFDLKQTLRYIYQGCYKGSKYLNGYMERDGTTFDYYSLDSISSISSQPDSTNEKPEVPTSGEKGIPGFEVRFAIAGLLAVAYLLRRRE